MQPAPIQVPSWRWCVGIMNGARIERLGFVRADDYEDAIRRAIKKFHLEERQQRLLLVWREGEIGHV
jgi:hypothetical protein